MSRKHCTLVSWELCHVNWLLVTVISEAFPTSVFRVVKLKMEAANTFEMSVLLLITNLHNVIYKDFSLNQ